MKSTRPIPIRLEEDIYKRVAEIAEAKRQSSHAFMRHAIIDKLHEEEKRNSFFQDAMNAWEHYEETGLHVTSEEALKWIRSWGTNEELEPPQCHV